MFKDVINGFVSSIMNSNPNDVDNNRTLTELISDPLAKRALEFTISLKKFGIDTIQMKEIKNGVQFNIVYKNNDFCVRIYNNKVRGVSIDWSQVKNEEVRKDLESMIDGTYDETKLEQALYISDNPNKFVIGSDETGKGDLFGGMVVSSVLVDPSYVETLLTKFNIADSKELTDESIVRTISDITSGFDILTIPITEADTFTVMTYDVPSLGIYAAVYNVPPSTYNGDYTKNDVNINTLLESYHTACILELLDSVSASEKWMNHIDDFVILIDQFGGSDTFKTLEDEMKKYVNQPIPIEKRPRAESNISVALASMFARYTFLNQMTALQLNTGLPELPLGCGNKAKKFYSTYTDKIDELGANNFIKLNFNITKED